MTEHGTPPSKVRQKLEEELLEALRQRQMEWIRAPHDERDPARHRFMEALQRLQ